MSVHANKTGGHKFEVIWNPATDDPRGRIAYAIESGRLENALAVLGATAVEDLGPVEMLRQLTQSTASLQRDLERKTRGLVVALRDNHKLSWTEIASLLYDDPTKRSSARGVYNAGVRQLGLINAEVSEDTDTD
ncbi:hypothetical protein AB0N09_41525 [Streptomyces erythrochromogenes]|uniref:hypothetical protein n=1 Tax=Streptomyces erythrochromogenes TaxID=285574 RepID=UPI003443B6DC